MATKHAMQGHTRPHTAIQGHNVPQKITIAPKEPSRTLVCLKSYTLVSRISVHVRLIYFDQLPRSYSGLQAYLFSGFLSNIQA